MASDDGFLYVPTLAESTPPISSSSCGMLSSEWTPTAMYTGTIPQSATAFTYQPYLTPQSSSTSMGEFPTPQPPQHTPHHHHQHAHIQGLPPLHKSSADLNTAFAPAILSQDDPNNPLLQNRPRSSPSTFGPSADELIWAGNPLRLTTGTGLEDSPTSFPAVTTSIAAASMSNASSLTYPPPGVRFRSPSMGHHSSNSIELKAPQPRRTYTPIAPHPPPHPGSLHAQRSWSMSGPGGIGTNGVFPTLSTTAAGVKRSREDDDGSTADPSSSTPSISQTAAAAAAAQTAAKRRKRSASTTIPTELGEEDRLLLRLKDEENLPWKDIAARFQTDLGKTYQVPALQMRFKRLRERLRVWTDDDVAALRHAHEYWEKNKFEIISAKMTEYGASDKWSARHCHRKWQEMNPGVDPYATQLQISTAAAQAAAQATPAFTNMSSTSSPTDAQPIFSFYHASTTA